LPNAGFTKGKPWLPIPASYETHNVASELRDPGSILNFYKRLLALRRDNAAMRAGDFADVAPDDPHVLCFLRRSGDQAVLVALNLSADTQPLAPDLARYGLSSAKVTPLLSTMQAPAASLRNAMLAPFAVYVVQLEKPAVSGAEPPTGPVAGRGR
jgi:glycosidase